MNFTKIPNELLYSPDLTPTDKVVWMLIASYQKGFFLTNDQASLILGISNRSWRYSIERLLETGLIERTPYKGRIYKYSIKECEWQILPIKVANIANQSGKYCHLGQEKERSKEKEYNNKKNNQENILLPQTPSRGFGEVVADEDPLSRIENFRNEIKVSQIKQEQYCKLLGVDVVTYLRVANEVLDEWVATDDFKDIGWKHLINHMRVKLKAQSQPVSRQDRRQQWRAQLAAQAQAAIKNLQ